MPRDTRLGYVPKHCQHRPSGRGYVRLQGRIFYTGPWGSPEARQEYDRLIGEWMAAGRRLPPAPPPAMTIVELTATFWRWAADHYPKKKDGSSEAEGFRAPLRVLRRTYGRTLLVDFGVPQMEAVRAEMVAQGWVRRSVNRQVQRLRRVFKWGVARGMVHPDTLARLQAMEPLRRGAADVVEGEPVRPVPDVALNATLPHLPSPVRALVLLQIYTGARPAELLDLRAVDVDTSVLPWEHRPSRHKLAHRDRDRVILFGPKARQVLSEFMVGRPVDAPLFSPREAVAEQRAEGAKVRRRPGQPAPPPKTGRRVGDQYTTATYRRAIAYACTRAEVVRWTPYQLRHNAATALRRAGGIDTAAAVLGHGHGSRVTAETYAEADLQQAKQAIEAAG